MLQNTLNIARRKISRSSKLFAVLCVCFIFMSILNIVADLFLGTAWQLNAYIAGGIVGHGFYCYYALKDRVSENGKFWYFVLNSISLIPAWLLSSGSLGSVSLFFIFYLALAMLYLQKKTRKYYLCIFFVTVLTCVYLELEFPHLIVPFPSDRIRSLDHVISFVDISIIIVIMFSMFKKVVDHDQFVLIKSKLHMEKSRQEIMIAKNIAEDATRAKSKFLNHMSHEIRTPLHGIIGATEHLLLSNLDTKQAELVDMLQASSGMLINIVNDLLDISKIEANKMEVYNHPFNLKNTLKDVENIVSSLLNKENINLIFEVNPNTPEFVFSDEVKIKQVLINLLSNAIKFTDFGHIKLVVDYLLIDQKNLLKIEVIDTGIGIDAKNIEKLFQPFSQIKAGKGKKTGGAGLGLVICKNLTEIMDGEIAVESKINSGTTFKVSIPIQKYGEIFSINNSELVDGAHEIASMRVLIAEDNLFNQMILSTILQNLGCKYDIANNGLEALTYVDKQHYQIILMDIQMPEMDGLTATTKILERYEKEQKQPPIIIGCTANAMEEDRQNGLNTGMKDFLIKPFTIDQLKSMIFKWTKSEVN